MVEVEQPHQRRAVALARIVDLPLPDSAFGFGLPECGHLSRRSTTLSTHLREFILELEERLSVRCRAGQVRRAYYNRADQFSNSESPAAGDSLSFCLSDGPWLLHYRFAK